MGTTTILKNVLDRKPMVAFPTQYALKPRHFEVKIKDLENYLGIKAGETTADGLFSIDALRCVGACGLAPVVLVGEDVYGRDEAKDIKTIVKKYREMV